MGKRRKKKRKPPVGASPGTLVVDKDAIKSKIRLMAYSETAFEEREVDHVESLGGLLREGWVVWVDIQGLGDEASLVRVGQIFSIHPLALEDVVNVPSRPKAESYDDHQVVITRMIQYDERGELDIEQASLVFGKGFVLSFQERYGDNLDLVRARIRTGKGLLRRGGSGYLAYALLDTIIDGYFPVLESIEQHLEALEDQTIAGASKVVVARLNGVRATLLMLRRAVTPQREAINSLIRDPSPFVSDAVRVYLRDTYDHLVHASESIDTSRELVSGLLNTYLSLLSNRMNEVMKVLTIMATIFVPLTFVVGVYGMNFDYMPELRVWWAYPLLLVLMGLAAVAMVFYFYRKGWIGKQ